MLACVGLVFFFCQAGRKLLTGAEPADEHGVLLCRSRQRFLSLLWRKGVAVEE